MHGVAVMSEVQRGSLDLQAPVTTVLPAYVESGGRQDAITLHHLMRMTSGLANDGGCWLYSVSASQVPNGCAALEHEERSPLDLLFEPARLRRSPYNGDLGVYNRTDWEPGGRWRYSNWGTMLSGRVLEVAAGAHHDALMRERVFEPACMARATLSAEDVYDSSNYALGEGAEAVDGHCPEPELGHDSRAPFFPDELACRARGPNGGVRASALDVAQFAHAFLGDLRGRGHLLDADHAHRMLCPAGGTHDGGCAGRADTGGSTWGDTYGYFNFHHVEDGHHVYSHGGGRAGFGSLMWLVPSEDLAVIVLSNDGGGARRMEPVARAALRCALDGECG